jgi:hypothetical protein
MHEFCHRCHAELPPHDEGTLSFCSHCGAPQVMLSEELQNQLETQSEAASAAANALPGARDAASQIWPIALRCVGLAAAITAALTLLSALWAPLVLLTWFWAMSSPVIVLGIFQARSPTTPITTGFGARLGLLTGLAIAFVLSATNTITMLAMRRANTMGDFDARMNAMVDQVHAQAAAQPGAPGLPFAQALTLPEFRAGMVLVGMAAMTLLLMVLTTAGGAFAGYLRSRPRA